MKIINTENAGEIKIFTDDYEPDIPEMISKIGNSDFSKGQKIRIMPDTHIGKGCMIGFTSTIGDCINPDFIGCDIGCTVSSVILKNAHIDHKYLPAIEEGIRKAIPTGFHRFGEMDQDEKLHAIADYISTFKPVMPFDEFEDYLFNFVFHKQSVIERKELESGNVYMAETVDTCKPGWLEEWGKKFGLSKDDLLDTAGTVGGGNHFIEMDENENQTAFTVHTGSRNVGKKVYDYWHKKVNDQKLSRCDNAATINMAKQLYLSTHQKLDKGFPDFLKKQLTNRCKEHLNGYLTDVETKEYVFDMMICQSWALANHYIIHDRIKDVIGKILPDFKPRTNSIISSHNYIDFENDIPMLRKGAVSAYKNKDVIIPFNMRDGIAFCKGKGNEDWNCSAPHGAGRRMSRKKAFETLSMDTFNEDMKDICTTTAVRETLDEAPEAYKPKDEIVRLISPTVDIVEFMHPVINIKAKD